ncbi:DUF1800 domain-containing protein [Neorhizobium petrolearium]|uniref:DUF1800 domain-containing protein n=1 Tax=Neorhizobium petrolearium TaxID=515361 RepID=A0ABY8M8X1_9HYPH|nr:DUF1800 domain-containing protein [Neorhizobium petrolearium]MCC2609968.1 DUF1800 domain-containing protein [Neorhizobium petrolearium]WGI70149.1 DUF1800 domain-containing protein [Neorhizobium petrolearium]
MVLSPPTLAAIRFGYGLRPGEDVSGDADALLAQIDKGVSEKPRFPREGLTGRVETATRIQAVLAAEAKARQAGKPNEDIRKEVQREAQRIYRQDAMARIAQALHSPMGFYERLASFWVDHFSTSVLKTLPMRAIVPLYEAQAIRPNLGGSFSKLLQAAILHPAMLIYLDQNQSVGPDSIAARRSGRGLNENLGRELLELHTLGAGSGYTQDDVRAAALVLTGLAVDNRALEVVYRPRLAEAGPISLLGRTYQDDEGDGQDHILMLEDLAANPKTAQHVSRKLVRHFIADDPPDEVVQTMVDAWTKSQGNLSDVYRAMLQHPRAWSDPGQKIKKPFEFVVSGFRALDLPEKSFATLVSDMDNEDESPIGKAMEMAGGAAARENARRRAGRANAITLGALQRMGEPIWQPPSPAGFADEALVWLAPGQLSERIAWSRLIARIFGQKMGPSEFLEAALGDAARPETRQIISQAPNKVHGITMVLASPEFNRR